MSSEGIGCCGLTIGRPRDREGFGVAATAMVVNPFVAIILAGVGLAIGSAGIPGGMVAASSIQEKDWYGACFMIVIGVLPCALFALLLLIPALLVCIGTPVVSCVLGCNEVVGVPLRTRTWPKYGAADPDVEEEL